MSEKIIEMCSHCGKETEISIKGGKCKYCGHYILPCSQCDMDKVDCNKCPYKKDLLNAKKIEMMEEKEMDLVELEQREKKLESVISNKHKELKRVKEKIKEMKENCNFEAIVILKSNVMGKEITELQNEVDRIIKDMKTIDHIGMRKLAYDVKGNKEGYYIKYEFKATKNDRNNLEMLFRKSDTIIKFMTLLLD